MIHKNDLAALFDEYVKEYDDDEERDLARLRITGKLTEDGQRHIMCRFAAQLVVDADWQTALHFTQLLRLSFAGRDIQEWCIMTMTIASASKSGCNVGSDFCDLLESQEILTTTAINNMSMTARSCRSGEAGTWEPSKEGFKDMRENLETTIALLGGERPEYDEDYKYEETPK